MQSDWKDRKGRFPIHYLFDGMRLDTFLIVSRIEFVGFVIVFVLLLGRLIRGIRAGESQLKTPSFFVPCPPRGF